MRKILSILLFSLSVAAVSAQNIRQNDLFSVTDVDALTDEQLDTIDIRKKLVINDYSMIGIQYGAGLSRVSWNPSQKQDHVVIPMNLGVTFTTYGKMFGYMPYFGFQVGVFYAQEGYQFKYNEEKNYTYSIVGAERAILDVVEVPLLFQFHYDMWNFKILAQIGCFGGYRLGIERFDTKVTNVVLKPEHQHSFLETDRRWDYGIKGGGGFALVFEPVEFQVMLSYKHSLSSLYEPDHASKYYYRYAYPYNFILSVGANFHITKRSGRTKAELKKMAREMVYNNNYQDGNTKSTGR